MANESPASGFVLRRSALGIAKSRMDRAAIVSKVEGADLARRPRHFSTPAQNTPTSSSERRDEKHLSSFHIYGPRLLTTHLCRSDHSRAYTASGQRSSPLSIDWPHNSKYRMAIDALQREVDKMSFWIDGYRVRVRHLKGVDQSKDPSLVLEDCERA